MGLCKEGCDYSDERLVKLLTESGVSDGNIINDLRW